MSDARKEYVELVVLLDEVRKRRFILDATGVEWFIYKNGNDYESGHDIAHDKDLARALKKALNC